MRRDVVISMPSLTTNKVHLVLSFQLMLSNIAINEEQISKVTTHESLTT